MFNLLIEAVIKNRLLVVLALLAAIAVSAFMIPKLNLDAFPDVTNVQVAVNTEAPGLAAEEVRAADHIPDRSGYVCTSRCRAGPFYF